MSIEGNIPPEPKPAQALQQQKLYEGSLRTIADAVRKNECILFLGSAIHAASTNPNYCHPASKCPPFGAQMAELLADKCHYPDPDRGNLQRVARYFEYINGGFRRPLVEEIKKLVHSESGGEASDGTPLPCSPLDPSPVLRGLVRLNFPIVITTNYDRLYEHALLTIGRERGIPKRYSKIIYSRDETIRTRDCAQTPSTIRPYLLKIHGDITNDDSIAITDEDYLHFVMRMRSEHPYHPVGKNVQTYLRRWTILFIGYRLGDYNLRALLAALRWKVKPGKIPPAYAVDVKPDVLIRDKMEKSQYVAFIEKNLWDFVPELYKKVTDQEMPQ